MSQERPPADAPNDSTSHRTGRRGFLGAAGAAAAALLAGCRVAGETDRKTETVSYSVDESDVDRIAVSGGDAETTVSGFDGSEIQVEATTFAVGQTDLSDVTVTRDTSGGRLDVGAEVSGNVGIGTFGGGLEELEVRVPAETRVTSVEIDDGTGHVSDVAGDISLDVDDGDVEVGPLDGALDVRGDDGSITVGDVDSLTADLDDSDLEMTAGATLGDVSVDDGDLDLAVTDLDGDVEIRTDDGDVTARVARSVDTTVVVNTDDQPVRVEDGLFDSVSTSAERTRGQIGDGTHRLSVEVDDGDVQLRPL